jgi:hypothetical protein
MMDFRAKRDLARALHFSITRVALYLSHMRWPDNGLTFNGRPGADQRSNHEDRSTGPVQCSEWLCRRVIRHHERPEPQFEDR